MATRKKFGRNETCPCGSGTKFKACCLGKIDWDQIVNSDNFDAYVRHLSTRGKNQLFMAEIAGALQLDSLSAPKNLKEFKNAFTPRAVKSIFEAVARIWPDLEDVERILKSESDASSGIYVGNYHPELICNAVARHSTYSETILLIDPFLHPKRVRDEFNPLLHPEQHQANALKAVRIWFTLGPWIDAGIVKFIRAPGDVSSNIWFETHAIQKKRFEDHPELAALMEDNVELKEKMFRDMKEYLMLHTPDEEVKKTFLQGHPNASEEQASEFLRFVQHRRDNHPYFLEKHPARNSEFLMESSGTNYEMAKRMATLSGSHLITDLPSRWKEMELDRDSVSFDQQRWSPFAKAFHGLDFKYLNEVPLQAALTLRKQDRLSDLRGFLRKMWRGCSGPNPFANENVDNLGAELQDRVREAEEEWRKIDRELVKWMGVGGAAALSIPLILTGGANWLGPLNAIAAGAVGLTTSTHQRISFKSRFPAAFFLDLKKRSSKP